LSVKSVKDVKDEGVFCIKWLTQNPLRDFKQKGGVVLHVLHTLPTLGFANVT